MPSKGKHKKQVKRPRIAVCGEKTQYPTRAAAEQMRRSYIASQGTNPDAVKVYFCKFCKHFHVGRIWRSDLREVQNRARHWK
jgi:hypothetical protein